MRASNLLWPTLAAALGLAVLLGLGTWQLQRLSWKEGLIARIEERARAAPVDLAEALARWRQTGDVEYVRVRMDGSFRHAREAHLFTTHKGRSGWRVITPFATADHLILVDRGFVPDQLKLPAARKQGSVAGRQTITGLARRPESQALFTPDNEPARNNWFWRDAGGMASALLDAEERTRLVPFFVEAEASAVPGGWPQGGVTQLSLPNKHLDYALTWYGLAGTLIVVYGFFAHSRWRAPTPQT